MSKLRIAVLMGGESSERDISLISGRAVLDALDLKKYQISVYDPKKDLVKLARDKGKIDVVFPVLHGKGGEDGTIQGLLELLHLPYVGSRVLASALAMDKAKTKEIYQYYKIPTPSYSVIKNDLASKISLPVVIKPISQGSSVGASVVLKKSQLSKALREAFALEDNIMVEEYIEGIEITASVLGNEKPLALPIIEIIPPDGKFFDRKVKYNGATKEIVPARISLTLTKEIQDLAIKAHICLGCRGFSRTDMIIKKNKIYVLETNTIPGLTAESLFPKAAKAKGINFSELLDRLIRLARAK